MHSALRRAFETLGSIALGACLAGCAPAAEVATPDPEDVARPGASASSAPRIPVPAQGSAVAISEPTQTADGSCTVPLGARGVVLVAEREVVPIEPDDAGPEAVHETAAVTADGACTSACVKVDAIQMEGLLGAARLALRTKTEPEGPRTRPRKANRRRTLTIRHEGGECSVTDKSGARIAAAERPMFDGAFTAIFNAAVKRPTPLPPD